MREDRLALSELVVPGCFFLARKDAPARTPFVPDLRRLPEEGPSACRHCLTYQGGGSSIRRELIEMVEDARQKVFVASYLLDDSALRLALVRAVDRLRGGVYVLSALDDKGLDKAINAMEDDSASINEQLEYRNFKSLTQKGVYVRGYPSCHAKFVVVDDRIALVSSANLMAKAFDVTGENGVVVFDRHDVERLARLFARLWQASPWDIPPGRDRQPVQHRNAARAGSGLSREERSTGPVWTWGSEHHILAALRDIVDSAREDLILATFSLARMASRPELLLDPVRRAVSERGVRVRLLLRSRNHVAAQRMEAAAFADAGVEIYPDKLIHAKGVIADGRRGALFSANFEAEKGLTGGVEVGMRLDGTSALREALRYFEHAMAEVDMRWVSEPSAGELAASLVVDMKSIARWPLAGTMEIATDGESWTRLAGSARHGGPCLFEQLDDGSIHLFCGSEQWRLAAAGDGMPRRMKIHEQIGRDQPASKRLNDWLTARKRPEGLVRGICTATLVPVIVEASSSGHWL